MYIGTIIKLVKFTKIWQGNICGHIKSATANIYFYKVNLEYLSPFFICFEMTTSTKSLLVSYMGVHYVVMKKKARFFMLSQDDN